MDLYDELKRGDAIRIKFGSCGSQAAVVHDRTSHGNVRVWKLSASRRVWKGPLRIWPDDVMSRLSEDEAKRLPPLAAICRAEGRP